MGLLPVRANTILFVETLVLHSELLGEPQGTHTRTGVKQWFEIRPLSAREFAQGQQINSVVSHELKCVFFAGANTSMRLTTESGTRIFNVDSVVNENEANRFLVWRCTEVS